MPLARLILIVSMRSGENIQIRTNGHLYLMSTVMYCYASSYNIGLEYQAEILTFLMTLQACTGLLLFEAIHNIDLHSRCVFNM